MAYFGSSINESPVLAEQVGAEIKNGSGKAVKYSDGKVVLAGAGEAICGVLIMQTPDVAAGDDVTMQYKDIGMVAAGGDFMKGDALEVGADGCFVKAESGKACARALEDGVAGCFARAHICIVPMV